MCLEEYLNGICNHPRLCTNEGLVKFLTEDDILVRINNQT